MMLRTSAKIPLIEAIKISFLKHKRIYFICMRERVCVVFLSHLVVVDVVVLFIARQSAIT